LIETDSWSDEKMEFARIKSSYMILGSFSPDMQYELQGGYFGETHALIQSTDLVRNEVSLTIPWTNIGRSV
jgi:hypothetical protein